MRNQRRLIPSTSALTAFEAVARSGSFTLAAQELSLTQSAVSRQVRVLEEQLDCALFKRSSRKVELTEAGQLYAVEVQQALQIVRDATLNVVSKGQDQVLNIAILPTFGTRWLMPRISGFVAQYPDITLNFTTRIGKFDFLADGLDIAIYHGVPDWPDVECTLLLNETVVPAVSPEFRKENRVAAPIDLLRLPRLSMHSRPTAWSNWFQAQGIMLDDKSGMSFEHFSTLSQACIAGVGVALMPEFLIEPELARNDLVQIGPSVVNDSAYYVARPVKLPENKAARLFEQWLMTEAARP
ncbi:MAG: LysR substrate-binding domain-containing protein [Paracoccaceae bacterium]